MHKEDVLSKKESKEMKASTTYHNNFSNSDNNNITITDSKRVGYRQLQKQKFLETNKYFRR